MKTFKEWYQGLSQKTQDYVAQFYWVDIDKEDGYKVKLLSNTKEWLDDIRYGAVQSGRYLSDKNAYLLELLALNNLMQPVNGKTALSRDESVSLLCKLYRSMMTSHFEDFLPYLPRDIAIDIVKQVRNQSYYDDDSHPKAYDLKDLLFITEDFNDIHFDLLQEGIELSDKNIEILGKNEALRLIRQNPSRLTIYADNLNDEVFDELFFGKDRLSEDQMARVLRRNYCGNRDTFKSSLDAIEDFVKRCVSVDKKMLRFLPELITYRGEISDLVNSHKSRTKLAEEFGNPNDEGINVLTDEELENIPAKFKYKYSKELREMFNLAFCCMNERLATNRAKKIGELASIVKLYKYNYKDIINALYADDTNSTTAFVTV